MTPASLADFRTALADLPSADAAAREIGRAHV